MRKKATVEKPLHRQIAERIVAERRSGEMSQGNVVQVLVKRHGWIHAAIVYTRMMKRTAGTEVVLAPIPAGGKHGWVTLKCRSSLSDSPYLKPAVRTFTKAEIAAALEDTMDHRDAVVVRKREAAARGREALGRYDPTRSDWRSGHLSGSNIGCGDIVTVRGPGHNWTARVGTVNFRTGKVGIVREHVSDDANLRVLDAFFFSSQKRREYRWIHPDYITAVRSPEKRLPVSLTDQHRLEIANKNFVQLRFGREFIESSYVVGRTKADAAKGSTYECAEYIIYYDTVRGLYWRATGSFD